MRLRMLILAVAVVFILPTGVMAATKTADDAKQLVMEWLKRDQRPLGTALGQQAKEVQTFRDDKGEPMYHVVYLDPSGFVIVPADDLVEPIIAFVSQGRFDPSLNNPLGALVSGDLPARVAHVQALRAAPPGAHVLKARDKWRALQPGPKGATNPAPASPLLSTVSDMRIAPFVQTLWNQGTANNGLACYNYYTPPYAAGAPSNYVCGCNATALAQLIRYFRYPIKGVGTNSFSISIDGSNTTANLLGGDGIGGPYSWANMPPNPDNPSIAQCQAIGALAHDCALACASDFEPDGTGGSIYAGTAALQQTFGYGNALCMGSSAGFQMTPAFLAMVNANLDARLPLAFFIVGTFGSAPGGHIVVCDGYGYSLSTLYHHINMGWGGADNAWYALPAIETSDGFAYCTNLYACVYNIYTNGSGEIISGRVTTGNVPLASATVVANLATGGAYTARTDTNGIYALAGIPSSSTYTLTVSLTNFVPVLTNCTTGRSDNGTNCGNVWGENFSLSPGNNPPLITRQPWSQPFVDLGGVASFSVAAIGKAPLGFQWQFNGTNLPGGSLPGISITNVQLTNVGNYSVIITNAYGNTTSMIAALSLALPPTSSGSAGPPGFIARSVQIDYSGADSTAVMNSITSMEAALGPVTTNHTDGTGLASAGLFVDPLTGLYCVNVANLLEADANGSFFVPG